jgi:hypothetical protein
MLAVVQHERSAHQRVDKPRLGAAGLGGWRKCPSFGTGRVYGTATPPFEGRRKEKKALERRA